MTHYLYSKFKNYNILILYDYRYYCDFKIVFNLLIKYITGVSDGHSPYLVYTCPNTDTLCYNTDTLYTTI